MIQLHKINKIYNPGTNTAVHALKDVDIKICNGEMIAITGPSGSGKSTLLHILAGIDEPTSGQYLFRELDMAKMPDREKCKLRNTKIGLIMQSFGLLGNESVLRNVCLPQIIGNTYDRATVTRAKEILATVGLADLAEKPVNQLSGGQKQRVAIARALTMNTEIILADEPTGALDSHNAMELMNLFKEINSRGVTVVIVTHNPLVAKCCRRQYCIIDGQIYAPDHETLNR